MMVSLIKYVFWCFFVLVNTVSAAEQLKMDLRPDGLYINNVNAAVLQKIYEDFGYHDFVTEDKKIPAIFLESMPVDFNEIEDQNVRNRLFIAIMAPLALKINEEVMLERGHILELGNDFEKNGKLSSKQVKELEKLATKYDIFTRMKGKDRYEILLSDLEIRVDQVAPALIIAVAAAESNWGTADEVRQGNALYKLKDWFTDKGIKPKGEDDDSYRIKTYPDLLSAIRDYVLKLNSDINFQHMWVARKQLRNHNQMLKGRTTVNGMVLGSPLENYAGLLNYILTFYDLINIDMSKLKSITFEGEN